MSVADTMGTQQQTTNGTERSAFVRRLGELLADWGMGESDELTDHFDAQLQDVSDQDLFATVDRVATTGGEWGHHRCDHVARRVSRLTMERVLEPASAIEAGSTLQAIAQRPVIFMGNHLSFVDVNVLDFLLAKAGYTDTANKLSVIVGPKVYAKPIRRLASLCFGTIKIPQSSTRASGEAIMSIRDVAKIARRMLDTARERQKLGEHLLVFPEGSRSRDGSMQACLTAVARYVEHGDALIVPFGLWGTEKLVPLDDDQVHRATCHIKIGDPIEASELLSRSGRKRGVTSDALGFLIADLLPDAYRGAYGLEAAPNRAAARQVADALSGKQYSAA